MAKTCTREIPSSIFFGVVFYDVILVSLFLLPSFLPFFSSFSCSPFIFLISIMCYVRRLAAS